MAQIEILKRNVTLSASQINTVKRNAISRRNKVPNLRFGKLAVASDADVD